MPVTIVTIEDLIQFKEELILEFKQILENSGVNQKEQWIKTPELKKILKISHGTLQNLRINGTIPYTKIGGIIYYNKQEILKIIESHKIQHFGR